MASVWGELKRRNVVRVAIAYAIVSWLILQLTDVLMPLLGLPEWVGIGNVVDEPVLVQHLVEHRSGATGEYDVGVVDLGFHLADRLLHGLGRAQIEALELDFRVQGVERFGDLGDTRGRGINHDLSLFLRLGDDRGPIFLAFVIGAKFGRLHPSIHFRRNRFRRRRRRGRRQ